MAKNLNKILLILAVILFVLHVPFSNVLWRSDIFILYDYPGEGRYVANILWESGMYLIAWVFIFLLWIETRKGFYFVFFIWWSYNVLTYFLFYSQNTDFIGLPLLLIIWYFYGKKRKI